MSFACKNLGSYTFLSEYKIRHKNLTLTGGKFAINKTQTGVKITPVDDLCITLNVQNLLNIFHYYGKQNREENSAKYPPKTAIQSVHTRAHVTTQVVDFGVNFLKPHVYAFL